MVIPSRFNSTSVSICAASGADGGGGRCPRNSLNACKVRKPKKPTMTIPMTIRLMIKARCLEGVMLLLPFQLEIANRDRIPFLHASLTQSFVYAKRLHDLLKSSQRTIVFPISHLGRAFNSHTCDAPFVLACVRDKKFARILLRFIDWQRQFCFFEHGGIGQFLMSLDQEFARVRTCQRRYGHELDFKLLELLLDSSESFLHFRLVDLVERYQLRLFRQIWVKERQLGIDLAIIRQRVF